MFFWSTCYNVGILSLGSLDLIVLGYLLLFLLAHLSFFQACLIKRFFLPPALFGASWGAGFIKDSTVCSSAAYSELDSIDILSRNFSGEISDWVRDATFYDATCYWLDFSGTISSFFDWDLLDSEDSTDELRPPNTMSC